MSNVNDIKEKTHVKSFRENKQTADGNKAKWNNQVDTILQRGDNYIPKEKSIQKSTLNYFERIKEKEKERERETRVRHFETACSNAFSNSKPNDKQKKKKSFADDYKNKTTVPTNEKQKRVYPELLKSNETVKGLLCIQERGINHYESYPNQFRPRATVLNPSDQLVKMNTKKQLLPCYQGQYASQRTIRGYSNTHSRLFTHEEAKTESNGCPSHKGSASRIKYVHRIHLKDKTDNVNHLISYHYGPKFKEESITDKPNRSNYRNIVRKTIETLNEDYVPQVYL